MAAILYLLIVLNKNQRKPASALADQSKKTTLIQKKIPYLLLGDNFGTFSINRVFMAAILDLLILLNIDQRNFFH